MLKVFTKLIFSDLTFNQENLENIVEEIEDWKLLAFVIGERNSQDDFVRFCADHKNEEKKTLTMLKQWQTMHPYASWTLLYQALIKMNEKVMSNRILNVYLTGQFEMIHIYISLQYDFFE